MIEVKLVVSKDRIRKNEGFAKSILVTGLSYRQANMICGSRFEITHHLHARRGNEIFFKPICYAHTAANTDDGMFYAYFDAYGELAGREYVSLEEEDAHLVREYISEFAHIYKLEKTEVAEQNRFTDIAGRFNS